VAPVVLAPPPATASSALVVAGAHEETTATVVTAFFSGLSDDLVEEKMDYTPIAPGRLAAPEHPPAISLDEPGPFGF
jgi:hypothetical protein